MSANPESTAPKPTERIMSIDALRGFDMFWITGGDALAIALLGLLPWSWASSLQQQFEHVEWEGFRFYDLIFPLFLFLVGCSIPLSLSKFADRPSEAHWRILRRIVLLFFMGLIYNRIFDFDWANLRYPGVLQRIGVCYGMAAFVYLYGGIRGSAIAIPIILIGYWCLMAFVSIPPSPNASNEMVPSNSDSTTRVLGIVQAGDFSKEGNLGGYIDRRFLPGRIYEDYYGYGDNEGILSTIPAIATTLLGILAGAWLRKKEITGLKKSQSLFACGVTLVIAGWGWGFYFPIIKNLWTSSFVLLAGGWSCILLSLFYVLIDVAKLHRYFFFWTVIGMNAITIYMLQHIIDFESISRYFLGGTSKIIESRLPGLATAILIFGTLSAKWLVLLFLFRNKLFLRL
jgi:predicted acyltransferase